jgi:hypothetical protein
VNVIGLAGLPARPLGEFSWSFYDGDGHSVWPLSHLNCANSENGITPFDCPPSLQPAAVGAFSLECPKPGEDNVPIRVRCRCRLRWTVRPAPRWPSCRCRAGGRPEAARRAGLEVVEKLLTSEASKGLFWLG